MNAASSTPVAWPLPGASPWRWLLVAAMVALLVLSLLPPSADLPSTGWDKTNHVLGFAALGWLGHRSWPGRLRATLVGLLAYGVLIEGLQSLTPDRSAEFADVIADGIGLALGAALSVFVAARR